MMRRSCCIAIAVALVTMSLGCSSTRVETRGYSLSFKPEATIKIIDCITTEQVIQDSKGLVAKGQAGPAGFSTQVLENDEVIIVRTTAEGHRQIKAALRDLREQDDSASSK